MAALALTDTDQRIIAILNPLCGQRQLRHLDVHHVHYRVFPTRKHVGKIGVLEPIQGQSERAADGPASVSGCIFFNGDLNALYSHFYCAGFAVDDGSRLHRGFREFAKRTQHSSQRQSIL